MKPAPFDYERPASVEAATQMLAQAQNARILAGGQTLGPMLNLRLAQPSLLVDITRIPDLVRVEERAGTVTLGACVTHAAIEDRRIGDFTQGLLPRVARGIAYRAVRNRGTLGGSIAHADPAADWLTCFMALGAAVLIQGEHGVREAAIGDFVRGALACDLRLGELITGIRLPRLSPDARWGYAKICRKEGEFAEAIGVYISDPQRNFERLVAGAAGGPPLILAPPPAASLPEADAGQMTRLLRDAGYVADAYGMQIHAAAMLRAVREAATVAQAAR